MGSQNSEHSGSMNSDELSNLIGHNYLAPQPALALPTVDLHMLVDIAAQNSQWSPNTAQRIREETHLLLDDGSTRKDTGPNQGKASSNLCKNSKALSNDSTANKGNSTTPLL